MGEAVSNAVNSMSAIKKMVYENKSLTMPELKTALDADWGGHDILRQRLMARSPKWANNDPYADEIAREMMDFFVDRSEHHAAQFPDVIFPCSVGTFSWYSMIGKEVGASADGRHAGDPIAPNFSPAPGTDVSGPTSAINSYVKMRVTDLAAGAPLDLRFSSSGLKGDGGTDRLAGLIQAFIAMQGNMLTVTVTDVKELKAAMEEPEKYRHLRVRMGGWSAYFVMLGREQQLLHISKVEHGLV
jgi:formate C-acetyltransferase